MLIKQIDTKDDPHFYHPDQPGSVRALTDSSGVVQNTYDYDAYGKVLTTISLPEKLGCYTYK
jgi:uncharacterized protein RhaS with RHS repeats